jgi:nucleoside-diphosphate-sugar epimerase
MVAASMSGLDERDMADLLAGMDRCARPLRGARILVTGATGWFGTWLLDALVALDRSHGLGLTIVAVSRDPAAFRHRHPALHDAAQIVWFTADVRTSLREAPGPFTHIIHAATDSTAKGATDSPRQMFETIVDGTRNVLAHAARRPGTKVLLISSGAVYGPQPSDVARLGEDHRGAPDVLDPASTYAEGKRAAELLGAIAHKTHGVHVTIARCFAFVGPHMPFDAHFAIGNFIRDTLEGREVLVRGDGTPLRSYQYMTDLVNWLVTILIEGRPLRAYNVGSDEALSIADLARRSTVIAGNDARVRIANEGGGGRNYVPDISRARGELALANRVSLDDALRRTQAWLRFSRLAGVDAVVPELVGGRAC